MSTDKRTWFKLEVKREDIVDSRLPWCRWCAIEVALIRTFKCDQWVNPIPLVRYTDAAMFAPSGGLIDLEFRAEAARHKYMEAYDSFSPIGQKSFVVSATGLPRFAIETLESKGLLIGILRVKNPLLNGEPATK